MKTLTEHEKEYIRYQESVKKEMKEDSIWEWTKALWSAIGIIFLLFALVAVLSCGSSREDDPTPTPAPKTISANFVGTWKVMTKKNPASGGYIANTDNTLFVTVTATTVKYKTGNGGDFEGTGVIENGSNADMIQLSNGTKLTMFKTLQQDGTQNFYFVHANFMADDYMVKKN